MDIYSVLQTYSKNVISSHILKSPYNEIYSDIIEKNDMLYESILIMNQGVHIPLKSFFESIQKKEYYISYIDDNELSIQELNKEMISYRNEKHISMDKYIETIYSNIFQLKNNRFKDINYDKIIIHHINVYQTQLKELYDLLKDITHNGSIIIFFVTVTNDENSKSYKNKIRNSISSLTSMKLGNLFSLEEIILSIPQTNFKIQHIIPYRESLYLGYGKNNIYKFVLERN